MAGRVVFFLQQASYESAYQAASLAVTAAAMGDEVYLILAFGALRQFLADQFGDPQNDQERIESAKAETLGLPSPRRMLEEAKSLGARLAVCETLLKINDFSRIQAEDKLEIMGLSSIWRLTEGARVVAF